MTTILSCDTDLRTRVRFLGSFAFEVDGQPVEQWRAGKARMLFQYLFLNRGAVIPCDALRGALWPGVQPRSSSSLKVAAHAVRRVLQSLESDGQAPMELVHRSDGYMLTAGPAWVDIDEFNAAIRRHRQAAVEKSHEESIHWARRAMELYSGDFLAGETGDWIEDHRQWARNLALIALGELRVDALANEDWSEALRWCRRTLELDPCHEPTYQALMQLHAERGEFATVRDWYERCRHRLRVDLDMAPAERTERIRASVLGQGRQAVH